MFVLEMSINFHSQCSVILITQPFCYVGDADTSLNTGYGEEATEIINPNMGQS